MTEELPGDRNCVDVVERIAALQPKHIAVVDGEISWTYRDLVVEVHRRCSALTEAGVQAGNRVALIAESSAMYLATALAIWRAGAVLVTVYPSSSSEDLQYAVASSDPVLVVTDDDFNVGQLGPLVDVIPVSPLTMVDVPVVRQNAAANPTGLREPLHLICFSSGTTSRPKAIMQSAEAVLNCARTYAEVWHFGPEDRGIVCLPMAWMYGLASTSLAILYGGGTVVVVRRARPELIAEACERHNATFLAGVANTYAKLVQYVDQLEPDVRPFKALRLCISGGEPRNEAAFSRWTQQTGTAVLDAYCASECLPFVTYDSDRDAEPRPGSAGQVVPRARIRVVDAEGKDVPTGEVGEALSSGPGLMLGYWQDEDQTAAVITQDGWYRTQDLVRVDPDGYVYVVGRLSDLIIRAGVNISPGEVERVLRTHPDVADVAVVGMPDAMYGEQVVAAVVPKAGQEVDVAELMDFSRQHLTAYKVPSAFVLLDDLPVNATGKVSRKELAARLSTGREAAN
jgi:long-chain acyl-CoA synthetase